MNVFGLVTFSITTAIGAFTRLGALASDSTLVDLRTAYAAALSQQGEALAAELAEARFGGSMTRLVASGDAGLDAAEMAVSFALARDAEAVTPYGRLRHGRSTIRLLPPLVPGKIICAGRNYWEHARESTMPTPDDFPRGFVKVASTLGAADEDLPYPSSTQKLDYEVELAVIIGRGGRDIPADAAMDHVFGYTVFNDISARDWQYEERKKGNHLLGKNLDASGPLGPAIIPKRFVPSVDRLPLELRVNGELRQRSTTDRMIFSISQQIAHWSKMTLCSGDMIATGTPEGIAGASAGSEPPKYLVRGDVMEATVQGIGTLRNKII